jgi:hypothetical protein
MFQAVKISPRDWIVRGAILGALIGGTIASVPMLGMIGAGKDSMFMMLGATAFCWLPGGALGCLFGTLFGIWLNSGKTE